ncbi:hypothetical protein DFH08DRAFT_517267 [Mycena albidolilacea]|uniref:cellulose 1,4-beta-cellobiosidase (non-reducing end) n=1 Tax=Mycena albidolilacea TaxID=1033008 RepID=A0AAD6Z338_9AGAR|nr:hypothetical protein DFH08DRAFT_517267 [Mycena albidolilacea]
MDADSGVAESNGVVFSPVSTTEHLLTVAGPRYGTGYCDAQCPRDLNFINGVANSAGWVPSPNDNKLISPL